MMLREHLGVDDDDDLLDPRHRQHRLLPARSRRPRSHVTRRPAADVYDEIQSAKAAQDAADHEARKVLRDQRRAEHKDKWEQFKNKVKSSVS